MPEDFERLQRLIYDVEARVFDIQGQQANIRADVDAVWAHPNMQAVHEAIDYRTLGDRVMAMIHAEFAKYAEDICIGLNRVFKEHFENDEYEISEEEFHKIICDAQRLAF